MVKMLTKSGNSLALVLDKTLLQLAQLDENTPVQIEVEGGKLIVSPADPARRKKFEDAKKRSILRHAEAYKRLAQ